MCLVFILIYWHWLLMCTCFAASVQLQCDKTQIKATIEEELTIACSYAPMYRYFKKYWCRGSSRKTCEVVSDTENTVNTESTRFRLLQYRSMLYVEIRALRLEDTGVYWVGIDKPYADIMFLINVEVTEGKNHTRYTPPLLHDPNLGWTSTMNHNTKCNIRTVVLQRCPGLRIFFLQM